MTLLLALIENPAQARGEKCTESRQAIKFYRSATWSWQDKLGHYRTRTSYSERYSPSCRYLRWVAKLWVVRSHDARRKYEAHVRYIASINADPAKAICHVFGSYCSQAIAVARCESGLYVYATNGQYLGMFQMGSYARSRYGHGYDALSQARYAYAYFADSGYDWSPWECKP